MIIDSIWACGGGSRSKLLLQIHADVCGLPIYLTQVTEAVSLGSAMAAAVAARCYKNLFEATDNMVHVGGKIEPNPQNQQKYKFYYQMYKETYPRIKDLTNRMTNHLLTSA
jgi:sugar (pentulose or hexulose) kinase